MSPPMVNLAMKKDGPLVSDEELPAEKKIEIPAVVTVDTERIRCQRQASQTRRRRRVCGVAIAVVVVIAVTAAVLVGIKMHHRRHHRHHRPHAADGLEGGWSSSEESSEERQWGRDERHHDKPSRHQWTCKFGKKQISENVWVDPEHQLLHAKHARGLRTEPTMHVLHEYNRRMAAYLDMDNNKCYITRLDETFEEGYARWSSYETKGRDPRTLRVLTERKLELVVLRHVTDVHIYTHCQNSQTYWAVEIDKHLVTEQMTTVQV